MEEYTLLICDDTVAVLDSLNDYLSHDGYQIIPVSRGEEAVRVVQNKQIDLVVLDIMLPDKSGIEVCREIRRISDVPIIMLSAKSAERDRVTGLEVGADDYVTKPFSLRELAIRIRRVLERSDGSKKPAGLSFADLTLFPEENQAVIAGNTVNLTQKETRVLGFLLAHGTKPVSREQILNAVWGYEYFGDTRVVDTLVKRIRKKILLDGVHFSIQSVYGVGYKMEENP